MMAAFSMASMTDVIFLLLIFFMVTSTFVFPTALDIDLPQSSEQTSEKPATRIYITPEAAYYIQYADQEPDSIAPEQIEPRLRAILAQDPATTVAIHAATEVPYGKVVEVLNIGASNNIKMVLATKARAAAPADAVDTQTTPLTPSQEN